MSDLKLFIGIEISDKIKSDFKKLQNKNNSLASTKWTVPENLHLTAYFFGNTPVKMLQNLSSLIHLGLKNTKPFELEFNKYGIGPNPKNPRMIWAHYHRQPVFWALNEEMSRLYHPINPQHQNWKNPLPHITLARLKDPTVISQIDWGSTPPPPLKVEAIVLWKSILKPDGPEYFKLEKWKLRGQR